MQNFMLAQRVRDLEEGLKVLSPTVLQSLQGVVSTMSFANENNQKDSIH